MIDKLYTNEKTTNTKSKTLLDSAKQHVLVLHFSSFAGKSKYGLVRNSIYAMMKQVDIVFTERCVSIEKLITSIHSLGKSANEST